MAKISPPIQPFIETLSDLVSLFKALEIPYVIIGGLAVSLLSRPRLTQDVDGLIEISVSQLDVFLARGREFNLEPRLKDALDFAKKRHVILFRHRKSGIGIDLSLAILPFQKEMMRRSKKVRLGRLALRVPTPEDVVITKAVAHRPRDLGDIEALLTLHPRMDFKRVRYWVKEFAKVLEMPEIVSDLERLIRDSKKPLKKD